MNEDQKDGQYHFPTSKNDNWTLFSREVEGLDIIEKQSTTKKNDLTNV